MKETLRIIAVSALITAALIKGAPVLAQAAPVNVSIVHTSDLDLSTEDGRAQLNRRLAAAARDVCGTASDADLEAKNDVRQCRADVLSAAKKRGEALVAGRSTERTIRIASR